MAEKRSTRVVTQFKPGKEQGLTRQVDDPITLGIDGSIVINTAKLQPPKNIYDADVAWVVRRKPEFVSFFFAKEDLNTEQFRTRVEIKYAIEPFYYHVFRNTRDFHEVLKNDRDLGGPVHQTVEDLMKRTAARDHSEWANFEVMSRNGVHACIDFFLLPPAGVARLAMGGGSNWLDANGVLRIYTTSVEVRAMLDECAKIAAELAPLFPATETEQ